MSPVAGCATIRKVCHLTPRVQELNQSEKCLSGEIILVTGGGKGIGRKLSLALAAHRPKHIILWGRDRDWLELTSRDIQAKGVEASFYQCDVSLREQVYTQAAAVQREVGNVTLLVNNAGTVCGKAILELNPHELQHCLKVNTLAQFWTIKAFLPPMIEQGSGHIVCINSVLGLMGLKGLGDYSTTKFALTGLMETVRRELSMYPGIMMTTVHPYQVQNDMFAGMTVRFPKLFPPLTEACVIRETLSAIQYGKRQVVLPAYFHLVLFLRSVLPVACMVPCYKFLGLHRLMENFKGHNS
ncbi:DHRS3-like protein [Mya arenaria]|uniref:DHRS3-like protein n=1 Tax=Mya arenaria TaxID=6604 RepID=A0ABY7FJ82_MYAAR|nr:DHRS3-like protein [Mya arenaria]